MAGELVRDQHAGFGEEFRNLLDEDPNLAGTIVAKVEMAMELHPTDRLKNDKALRGQDLRSIRRIRIDNSRVYFTVKDNVFWMLHIDRAKKQNKMLERTKELLRRRLGQIQFRHDEEY